MILKNVKNYFNAATSTTSCSNATLALKTSARRRRAHVLKPALVATATTVAGAVKPMITNSVILQLPSNATAKGKSKVHFSEAAQRRAKTCTSPVRVSVTSGRSRTSVPLPTRLERPVFRAVSAEALEAADSKMKGVPVTYVRDILESVGSRMLSVLASTVTPPMVVSSSSSLPKEVDVTVSNAQAAVFPTHMLAVHSSTQSTSLGARKVTLFPAHSLVLAAHCANLPPLPASISSAPTPVPSDDSDDVHLTLPILPLSIPSPETFAPLSSYLYTRRADSLLRSLLPTFPSSVPVPTTVAALTQTLEQAPSPTLLAHALKVHGVWRNACALGVHDERLWGVLDLAWRACVGGLEERIAIDA